MSRRRIPFNWRPLRSGARCSGLPRRGIKFNGRGGRGQAGVGPAWARSTARVRVRAGTVVRARGHRVHSDPESAFSQGNLVSDFYIY